MIRNASTSRALLARSSMNSRMRALAPYLRTRRRDPDDPEYPQDLELGQRQAGQEIHPTETAEEVMGLRVGREQAKCEVEQEDEAQERIHDERDLTQGCVGQPDVEDEVEQRQHRQGADEELVARPAPWLGRGRRGRRSHRTILRPSPDSIPWGRPLAQVCAVTAGRVTSANHEIGASARTAVIRALLAPHSRSPHSSLRSPLRKASRAMSPHEASSHSRIRRLDAPQVARRDAWRGQTRKSRM